MQLLNILEWKIEILLLHKHVNEFSDYLLLLKIHWKYPKDFVKNFLSHWEIEIVVHSKYLETLDGAVMLKVEESTYFPSFVAVLLVSFSVPGI